MSEQVRPRQGFGGFGRGRGGGGCGNGPGGGRGGGRMFDNGDLRLLIMALLAEKPRHGYEIIKALEEQVGGGYSPSPGVVYPTLTLLGELGHASVTEERGGRKLYTLSTEGHAILAPNRAVVDGILARIAETSGSRGRPPPQLVRAIENLITAVRLRLEGPPPKIQELRAMAAAIDAAAKAVEEV